MLVPPILMETGKVKNPWPNVDAHSGVLLQVNTIFRLSNVIVLIKALKYFSFQKITPVFNEG
jgi:hypothetical protein